MVMVKVSEQQVLEALRQIVDPDLHKDIVSLGFVKDVRICEGVVAFTIELTTPACPVRAQFESAAKQLVGSIPGVKQVNVQITSQVRRGLPEKSPLPGVKNIIAVGSGKGGVGKTTASVNIAVALAQTGAKMGLLDADIYGPNVPRMMGVNRQLEAMEVEVDGKRELRILPLENWGVKMMSMGFILNEDEAVAWRGPMLMKAMQQFLQDVHWGELDYLLVDLPPGTGDVQISLCQLVPVTGGVLITTPQRVALSDVLKGIQVFHKLEVPVLGVIENMSYFVCPHCHKESDMFPTGGVREECELRGIKFLGSVPFVPEVAAGGDMGKPIVATNPHLPASKAFAIIAEQLAAAISTYNINFCDACLPTRTRRTQRTPLSQRF